MAPDLRKLSESVLGPQVPERGSRRLERRLGTFSRVFAFVRIHQGATMGTEPDERRLIVLVAAFIVVCIVIGGVWPWLIR